MFRKCVTKQSLNSNVLAMPHSGIRKVMEVAWGLEREGRLVRHLEVGQPNFKTPKGIVDACTAALQIEANQRYCPNLGIRELREAAADYFTKRGQQSIPFERVAVTPGCVFSMASSILAVVEPGQKILLPDPGWPNYEMASQAAGAIPIYYPLRADNGWKPDFDELSLLVEQNPDVKMIALCNPSNPTGQVFDYPTLDKFLSIATQSDLYVLSDEIYGDIVFAGDDKAPSLLGCDDFNSDKHIVISGVSKTYSMTGFRVGFMTASKLILDQVSKLGESFISCGVPFAQVAATAALSGAADNEVSEMLKSYSNRCAIVVETLSTHGLLHHLPGGPPTGALYCLLHVGTLLSLFQNDVTNLCLSLLHEKGIATSPGSCFGSASSEYVRLCFAGVDEESLRSAVDDICLFIKEKEKLLV